MAIDDQAVYYDAGGIETLDIIRAKLTREQYQGFLLGNTLKYLCRMGRKPDADPVRDAEKAAIYLDLLVEELRHANRN